MFRSWTSSRRVQSMGCTIDIDTGGTFTDGFFVRGDSVASVKVPTTPHDLTVCFLNCIEAGAARFGMTVEDLLYEGEVIRFSNTIGTNTIIQRDGSRLGLIVTAGYEELAPAHSSDGKAPLVFSEMVLGIDEEVSRSGDVVKAPSAQRILATAQTLIDRGARCLVVALVHSEFNPENERYVRDTVKQEYPRDYLGSVPVFLSSDISRRSGRAERINAAVLNAYIHSKLARLLYKAGEDLRERLYRRSLFIVHNNGAVARVAKTRSIQTYNSGPAAGLMGARMTGELYGASSLISTDMGGTSFDLGYVRNGQASYTLRPDIEGFAVNVPMMEIRTVGAGGGSIASVVDGKLQVGPQSAGALPGPVCFDLGGLEPTVTDADLILGVLDPDYFLGGTMKLDREKARTVLEQKVAVPLGIPVEAAAWEIKSRIDQAMGEEIKRVRNKMGGEQDPLLIVYGGAGPAHCCQMGRVAGLRKIVITPFSAVFSAFSASHMDVGHRYDSRVDLALDKERDLGALDQTIAAMERKAFRDMRGEGFALDQVRLSLELFVRAGEDGSEVRFGAARDFFRHDEKVQDVIRRARELLDGEPPSGVEGLTLTMVCLIAHAEVPHSEMAEVPPASAGVEQAQKGSRGLILDAGRAERSTPVYDRSLLTNGHSLPGPALVESEQTTLLVPPGWRMIVDQHNHAVLEEGPGS
jgi:N-methylhydantoinase A/acetophenone carboxylase